MATLPVKGVLTRLQSIHTAAGASGGGCAPSGPALQFIVDQLRADNHAVRELSIQVLCWVLRENNRYDAALVQNEAVRLGAMEPVCQTLGDSKSGHKLGEARAQLFCRFTSPRVCEHHVNVSFGWAAWGQAKSARVKPSWACTHCKRGTLWCTETHAWELTVPEPNVTGCAAASEFLLQDAGLKAGGL